MQNPFEELKKEIIELKALVLERTEPLEKSKVEDTLSVEEAAKLLKVTNQSVHTYIKKGFLSAQKIGRKYLLKRAEVEASLNEVKSLRYKRA